MKGNGRRNNVPEEDVKKMLYYNKVLNYSYGHIGELLGWHKRTVYKRIKRAEEEGI